MPTYKNETALVDAIRKALLKEYPSAWVFKVHGGMMQMAGVPDILVCVEGRLFGFEVKHRKPTESEEHARGRASEQQLYQIEKIREAGGVAEVILSAEEALDIITLHL